MRWCGGGFTIGHCRAGVVHGCRSHCVCMLPKSHDNCGLKKRWGSPTHSWKVYRKSNWVAAWTSTKDVILDWRPRRPENLPSNRLTANKQKGEYICDSHPMYRRPVGTPNRTIGVFESGGQTRSVISQSKCVECASKANGAIGELEPVP